MYLNKEIPKEILKNLKLLVLDSDGVSIKRGTEILEKENGDLYQVSFKTEVISDELAEIINKLKEKISICISSGRSLIYLQSMYSKIIGGKTMLMAENGNLSLIEGKITQHFGYTDSYFEKIAKIREEIKRLPISGFEPKQFILTIHAEREIQEVYEIVKKYDPDNELKVMWNGEAFDVQKKWIDKGEGLKFLLSYLGIKKEQVVAIGDRINDKELIQAAGVGVSADQEKLPAEYFTIGNFLPGETLVKYLLETI